MGAHNFALNAGNCVASPLETESVIQNEDGVFHGIMSTYVGAKTLPRTPSPSGRTGGFFISSCA